MLTGGSAELCHIGGPKKQCLNVTHRRELSPIIPSRVSTQLWGPLRLKEPLKDNIPTQKSNKGDDHTLRWKTSHASACNPKERNESGYFADRVEATFRKELLDLGRAIKGFITPGE